MRKVFERFGVDYTQWRALTRVALKNDLRRRAIVSKQRGEKKPGRTSGIPGQLLFYTIYGIIFSGIAMSVPDFFLAANVIISYAMFIVAITVLMEFSTVVTSPDDYNILGFQPISSQTYFAARLTNVLMYNLAVMLAFGVVPAVTLAIKAHFNSSVAAAFLVGIILAGATTSMAMILLYAFLLRRLDGRRLKRGLTYLQLVASFVAYGGYLVMPRLFDNSEMAHRALPKTIAVLAYPGSWYASWVELAVGHTSLREIVPVIWSIIALILVFRFAAGRISLEFAEKLATQTTISEKPQLAKNHKKSWTPFPGKEQRAVWLLVRGQFRSDQRFRMGVLAIMPMTILYLLMAVMEGQMNDPFTPHATAGLMNMAVILFPTLLSGAMTRSDNYAASWIFYATPSDRAATVSALNRTVFIYFVIPYLLLFALILSIWVHHPIHVATHIVVLGLISYFVINVRMVANPELPFSRPPQKGERATSMFFITLLSVGIAAAVIPLLGRFIYISPRRIVSLIAGLALLNWAIERLGRVRVRRRILQSEFAG